MKLARYAGQICSKCIDVRIIVNKPDGRTETVRHRVKAKPGAWLNGQALVNVLKQESDMLSRELPAYDFRMVRLGPYRVNLIGELKA